jgi:hypothetical protein
MLALLQTAHITVGEYKKKKVKQENEKLEAAMLAICTTTAQKASAKIDH